MVTYPGYVAAVFIHDNRIISALIARAAPTAASGAADPRRVRAARVIRPWRLDRPGRAAVTPVSGRWPAQQLPGPAERPYRVALARPIYAGDRCAPPTRRRAGRDHLAAAGPAADQPAGEHRRDLTPAHFRVHLVPTHQPWFEDHLYWTRT
jgi:hypothetical protein